MIELKRTLRETPCRICLYGRGGVGKSTFGAASKRPVFVASEDGLENIDTVAVHPKDWGETLEAIDYLSTNKDFETIVVDSLDWLEPMCWDQVISDFNDTNSKKVKDIEGIGYGKGYVAAHMEWRRFINKLSTAWKNGKNIILIAHVQKKPTKNPAGEDYDSFQIKLNEKAAGLITEWVDVVGFAETEIVVDRVNHTAKGIATGRRVLRTAQSAAYSSKSRFNLPGKLDLDWHSFESALKASSFTQIPKLKEELEIALGKLNDDAIKERCKAFLSKRGENVASLREAIDTVNKKMNGDTNGG
jgi:hypothetical protein